MSLWTKSDSVHCSTLQGDSEPVSYCRRAPRRKVIIVTQEESILQSWVQFCIWCVQPNDMNLLQSQCDMLHGNLFPAVYVWAEFLLCHILQNKEILSSTICWKTDLHVSMVTLTSSHSPPLSNKEFNKIR